MADLDACASRFDRLRWTDSTAQIPCLTPMQSWPPCQLHKKVQGQADESQVVPRLHMHPSTPMLWQAGPCGLVSLATWPCPCGIWLSLWHSRWPSLYSCTVLTCWTRFHLEQPDRLDLHGLEDWWSCHQALDPMICSNHCLFQRPRIHDQYCHHLTAQWIQSQSHLPFEGLTDGSPLTEPRGLQWPGHSVSQLKWTGSTQYIKACCKCTRNDTD